MSHRSKLEAMLIRHEGFALKPYYCSSGKLTIGIGRNLEDTGITESEGYIFLANDILRVKRALSSEFIWFDDLNEARRDVIVSMVFNLGVNGFKKFKKTIKALSQKDFEKAAKEMLDSKWASQVKGRAEELALMLLSGKYPV